MNIDFTTRQLTLIQMLAEIKIDRHGEYMDKKEVKEYQDIIDLIDKRFNDDNDE